MINEIFQVLLWLTTIILVISGIDDLFIDLSYWFTRKKYKNNLPRFAEMDSKPEKPIALMIGAWKEYKVIGRTLTLALNKIKYSNYRILVGVYPNDLKTVKVVRDIARKDKRVILCLNVNDGPTTKADNLNNMYSCLKEYERRNGVFDIVLIHDSEDFIHPLSLKLFNYFIAYKGYYGIQIPVIPIKSKYGRFFHRTYCDAFAELHSKDLIVRQALGSFIPFAGTGMGFNRNAFFYLESKDDKSKVREQKPILKEEEENIYSRETFMNKFSSDVEDKFETEKIRTGLYVDENKPQETPRIVKRTVPIKQLSLLALIIVLVGILIITNTKVSYTGGKNKSNSESQLNNSTLQGDNTSTESTIETDENVAKDLTKVSLGYFDDNLNIVYINTNKTNYLVQESSWNDEKKATKRAVFLSKLMKDDNVKVIKVSNNEITIYRVVLGEFNSLESAKDKAVELRKNIID